MKIRLFRILLCAFVLFCFVSSCKDDKQPEDPVDKIITTNVSVPSPVEIEEGQSIFISLKGKTNIKDSDFVVLRSAANKDYRCPIINLTDSFQLEFKYPLIQEAWDSLLMRSVNPRQQEAKMKYKVTRDSTNLRRFTIMPDDKLMPGYDYYLKVPHRKFRDVNGFYNDSTEMKVTLPNDEKLSSLTLELSGVHNKYIVELLTEKRDKVLRSYIIEKDMDLLFPYLKEGSYCIRMTEDLNRNNLVDTGNLLEHRQPEKVKFYKLDDQFLIKIPERTELVQQINVEELFR